MDFLLPVQLSIASLLKKEFGGRLPADGIVTYYDFSTGAKAERTVHLPSVKNVYTYPTSLEADYPFCSVLSETSGFDDRTQNAQDERHSLTVQVWELLIDPEELSLRLELYAKLIHDILGENAYALAKENLLKRLKVEQHRFDFTFQTEDGFIRPVYLPITIEKIEI